MEAFKKGSNQGLADALSKMKSSGRIQIPGTVGYDLAYVVSIPTPTGRKVRFVTNWANFSSALTGSGASATTLIPFHTLRRF